jgi:chromosomal replication initiator protein
LTNKSLVEIGKKFGKKDHTTVVHAIKTVEQMMESDKEFFKEVDIITKYMQSL